jgi:gamma-glutamyltranspeptidase/glutathione hydrolase
VTTAPRRLDGANLVSQGRRAVVAPHYLAAQTAIAIMDRGGNAADAAIAANATLAVVAPETCGIGGDLFALVHSPGNPSPDALNASGRAGSGATGATARAAGLGHVPIHSPWAVTVPGCVDGWEALAARHASLRLTELLDPAIELAYEGFPVAPELSDELTRLEGLLHGQPAAISLYPNGTPPRPGETVRRPSLGTTLEAIATSGRAAFYTGHVGDQIIAATEGLLTLSDLDARQADWVDAISLDVMGWTGWTIPPNSQGYLTLAAAWIFEHLDPPRDPDDPLLTHAAIEAYRSVAWERDQVVSDSATAPHPSTWLLDQTRLEAKLDHLSLKGRAEWPAPEAAPGGTAYLCVQDDQGMGVSLIQSNFHGFGSGIGVGDAGFLLHDRGSGFSLVPGHPNEIGPGKRPLHTLAPSLWTEADSLAMLLGTRGGDFQPQTLLQMLAHIRWSGDDVATAQSRPRWTTREWRKTYTGIAHEPHLRPAVAEDLARLGHQPYAESDWMSGWGPVAVLTNQGGNLIGAADPRVASTAALT